MTIWGLSEVMGGSPVVTVVPNPWSARKIAPPGPKSWLRRWKVMGEMQKGLAEFVSIFVISIALVMSL